MIWIPLSTSVPIWFRERKRRKEKISPHLLSYSLHSFFLAYSILSFLLTYFLMLREIKEKIAAVLKTSVNARLLKYLNLSCDQKEAQQELLGCEEQQGT